MALTNAEKQSAHRKRTADKIARYERALRDIADMDASKDHQGNRNDLIACSAVSTAISALR